MKKTLKELRQLRAQKATRGKAALSQLQTLQALAEPTEAQATELTTLEAELVAIETDLPILDADILAAEASGRRSALFAGPAARSLARSYEADPSLTGGFAGITQFAGAVLGFAVGQPMQLDAAASNYMQNAGTAGEGYLVPPEYSSRIWEIAFNEPDLWALCNPEPTQSNTVLKPKDETTPWGAVGVQAVWRAEASQMAATKLAMSGEMMQLHELYAFCAASSEVLADAPMLQDRLTNQAGRAISWVASEAVPWGSGVGQPTGFMTSPSLITVNKDAGQAAKTLSVNNILTMLSRVLRAGGKPMWMANPDVIVQLGQLVIGQEPVWQPIAQGGMQANPFDGLLMGYPLIFSEHAQTLGTTGDLVCMNLAGGYYAANKSGGVDFASSIHLYFDQNLTAFRWTFRLNGQPYLSAPVAAAKGANTKSHFVALQTR